jgi:AbiU2
MANAAADPDAEFQNELRVFDNDVDEVVQCFYIWRTVHSAARRNRKVYDLLNRNAGFWVVALGSIQANSLIALGRIFDRHKDTHNVGRLLKLAVQNPAIFSKAAFRKRKEKDLPNASHLVDEIMKSVKEPTTSDFKRLEQFIEVRRRIYEKCYKQIRDKRYAHKQRMGRSAIFAQTNTRELARLVTDLSKLHRALWDWYRNGVRPRTSRLRGTAGNDIQESTLKFLQSLL